MLVIITCELVLFKLKINEIRKFGLNFEIIEINRKLNFYILIFILQNLLKIWIFSIFENSNINPKILK